MQKFLKLRGMVFQQILYDRENFVQQSIYCAKKDTQDLEN